MPLKLEPPLCGRLDHRLRVTQVHPSSALWGFPLAYSSWDTREYMVATIIAASDVIFCTLSNLAESRINDEQLALFLNFQQQLESSS
jgi:hypothetical protein